MSALDRCIESLSFCHLQDEQRWAAARLIVQQDVDAYVVGAGASLAEKRDALEALMAKFSELFPDERTDPVLVRSYIRRQLRKIEYDIRREAEQGAKSEAVPQEPAPSTAPANSDDNPAQAPSVTADENAPSTDQTTGDGAESPPERASAPSSGQ